MDIDYNRSQRKFSTIVDGKEYSLEYNEVDDDLWEFHCNYIQQNTDTYAREREVLDKLIEYALYYMKRNHIKLTDIDSCGQMSQFLKNRKVLEEAVANYCNKS